MESIATVIMTALIAGASDVATSAVKDAYKAVKGMLGTLFPTFELPVGTESSEAQTEPLAQMLTRLSPEDLANLLNEVQKLGDALNTDGTHPSLSQELSIIGNEVDKNASLDLESVPGSTQRIEKNKIRGNMTVVSRVHRN